jgi:hypothetical protein
VREVAVQGAVPQFAIVALISAVHSNESSRPSLLGAQAAVQCAMNCVAAFRRLRKTGGERRPPLTTSELLLVPFIASSTLAPLSSFFAAVTSACDSQAGS